MITKKQIWKIRAFAINLDWNLAFDGRSKGNRHLFRIVSIARELAEDCDVNVSIVEAGAWLHDSNLEKTVFGETLANKGKVVSFLEKIKVNKDDRIKILHCIETHDGRIKAKTREAKIVHDSDTLEKMGPLGIIRETWKRSQVGWNTEKIIKHLKTHLKKRESNLYTKKAKEKAKQLNMGLEIFWKTVDKQLKGGNWQ